MLDELKYYPVYQLYALIVIYLHYGALRNRTVSMLFILSGPEPPQSRKPLRLRWKEWDVTVPPSRWPPVIEVRNQTTEIPTGNQYIHSRRSQTTFSIGKKKQH